MRKKATRTPSTAFAQIGIDNLTILLHRQRGELLTGIAKTINLPDTQGGTMFDDEIIYKWLQLAMKHSGGNDSVWLEMLYAVACAVISIAMSAYNQMVYTRYLVTGCWE